MSGEDVLYLPASVVMTRESTLQHSSCIFYSWKKSNFSSEEIVYRILTASNSDLTRSGGYSKRRPGGPPRPALATLMLLIGSTF